MTCSILPNCEPACDLGRLLRARRHLHPGGAPDPARPGRGRPAAARRPSPRCSTRWPTGEVDLGFVPDRERHRGDGQRHHRRAHPRRRPADPARGRDGHPPPSHGPAGHRARRHPPRCRPTRTRWPSARSSWPGRCPGPSSGRPTRRRTRPGCSASPGPPTAPPSRPGWPPSATAWRSWPRTSRTTRRTRPGSSCVARTRVPRPTGHDKTSIVCFQRADHPGSLHGILGQFAARNINLTKLESRPTKQGLGDYCFVIDLQRPRRRRGGGRLPARPARRLGRREVPRLVPGRRRARPRAAAPGRRGLAGGRRLAARAARRDRVSPGGGAPGGVDRRDRRTAAGTVRAGGHVTLQTIDVDQHLFESRTTWSEYIDPAQRADALSITDDDAGWPWLTWRGSQADAARGADPRAFGAHRRGPPPPPAGRARPGVVRRAGARLLPARPAPGSPRSTSSGSTPPSCSRTTACCGSSGWRRTVTRSGPTPGPTTASWPTCCSDGEGRLFGVAHVLLHDPAWAVEEIRRVRAEGVRLAMIAPAPVDGKPLSHADFDPVWAAFSDEGVAPVFHVSEFESPLAPGLAAGEHEDGEQLFDSIFLYLAPAVALANLILNGVLERFPALRVGVVELTASWVPSFLLHIDGASDFYAPAPRRAVPATRRDRPSNYFLRQVRVAALPYEMPNRLVPKVGDDTFMIGSDWPHAEGVADPMAQARARRGRAGGPGAGQPAGRQRRLAARACDRRPRGRRGGAGAAARAVPAATGGPARRRRPAASTTSRCCAPTSSGPSASTRSLLGFPLVELFENRDYKGSTHLFFDLGHDNTLAFFDFPGSRSRSVRRGAGRVPPPRHLGRPGAVGRGAGPPRARPASRTQIESEISLYFSDPDGVRLELIAEDLGSLYGTPAALMARHRPGQPGRQGGADLEAACAWYEAAGATVTEPVAVGERAPGRRPARGALAHAVHPGHLRGRVRAAGGGVPAPGALRRRPRRRAGAPPRCCGVRGRQRHLRNPAHRLRRGTGWHPARVHGAARGPAGLRPRSHPLSIHGARVRIRRKDPHSLRRAP